MHGTVTISGVTAAQKRVEELPGRVRAGVRAELEEQLEALRTHVIVNKLSGQVLKPGSGALQRSLVIDITDVGNLMRGRLSTPLSSARLHEYGGVRQVPVLMPHRAQALRFLVAGQPVFALRTKAHPVVYPQRSFLRSALADRATAIVRALRGAIVAALGKKAS